MNAVGSAIRFQIPLSWSFCALEVLPQYREAARDEKKQKMCGIVA